MADFGTLTLTALGLALQQKVTSGTTLTFKRAGIGDKTLPDGTDASSLTKLENEKLSTTFTSISPGSNAVDLKFTFSNSGLSEGFFIRELGIFAADPDKGEILYAYANAGDKPDFLPAKGANIVEEIFEVVAAIGTAADVTATIDASLTYLPLTGGNMEGAINESQVTMASASTMKIGAADGNFILVTGTTTITGFDTIQAGTRRSLKFGGALTLTYNSSSMILPGATDFSVSAGDVAEFVSLGSGNWVCTDYQPVGGNLKKSGDTMTGSLILNGTPPLTVTSTTKVTNLNADLIDGLHANDTANNIPVYDANKSISGNSATATKLQTARGINGISFDGSQNITLPNTQVSILTGVLNHGATIPLPSGYAESQCYWTVSIYYIVVDDDGIVYCYTNGRTVVCTENQRGGIGMVNYMVIGVK